MTSRQLGIAVALGCAGLVAAGVREMRSPAVEPHGESDPCGDDVPVVAIDAHGKFYVNSLPIDADDLVARTSTTS